MKTSLPTAFLILVFGSLVLTSLTSTRPGNNDPKSLFKVKPGIHSEP